MERTLILLKPDALQRGLAGEIITRMEQRGLKIVGMKLMQLDDAFARRHYAEHEGKPFYESLVSYMTSGPVVVQVLQGEDAVMKNRDLMGATNPQEAAPGTIRADFAESIDANAVHGSDAVESAAREIAHFFTNDQICDR